MAKSDQFGTYYRAEVIDLRDCKDMVIDDLVVRKKSNKTVEAFFIDYGLYYSSCLLYAHKFFPCSAFDYWL